MNVREALLADKFQSRGLAVRVASFACESRENFEALINCFIADDPRLAQRSAWSVCLAARMEPASIVPHVGVLVAQLKRRNVHDAVIRNSVRVMDEITIPEEFHGEVLDACFKFIQDRKTAIAIKAFSLTIVFKLSKIYPEIKKELRIIIEENMDLESAGFRARGRKILARL